MEVMTTVKGSCVFPSVGLGSSMTEVKTWIVVGTGDARTDVTIGGEGVFAGVVGLTVGVSTGVELGVGVGRGVVSSSVGVGTTSPWPGVRAAIAMEQKRGERVDVR
jgi:hypothetical protein